MIPVTASNRMQGLRKIRSDKASEGLRPQKPGMVPGKAGFVAVVCGLSLAAAVLTWIAVGAPGKGAMLGWFDSSQGGPHPDGTAREVTHQSVNGERPEARAGRFKISETVAMDLLGGISTPEKGRKLRVKAGAAISPRLKALLDVLENGTEEEALQALRQLAALGGVENRQRLAAIMKDNAWSDKLRTEAARALMETGNAAEMALAARVLSVIGGDANTDTLSAMVMNPDLSESLRLEAALGLGRIGTPAACDALLNSFRTFTEPEIHEQLLGALGNFPFHQVEPLWKEYLNDPNTDSELRVAAVDALSNSTSDALPFLVTMAESDRDPEVREMSAWAIGAHGETGALGAELTRLVKAEPEADVRRRLYEALGEQTDNTAESLLPLIQSETDIAARVAGFNALGEAIKSGASSAEFDANIVPELTDVATSKETLNIRMRAVFALRRADTVAARQALEVISKTSNPKIATAARNGLKPAN